MPLDEITLPDGSKRKLGNIIPTRPRIRMAAAPVYGEVSTETLIPRSDWKQRIADLPASFDHPFLPYVHDQDGIGECNCDATTAAAEFKRKMQGLPDVKLSAPDLYDRINGGSDNGSLLEDALHEATVGGLATVADAGGNFVWHRGQKRASSDQRRPYIVLQAKLCPTFDHVISASLRDEPLISGIMWYDQDDLDKNGWLAHRGRGNNGGHAIFGFKPAYNGQDFGIIHRQSWGTQYYPQFNNCFIIPEARYAGDVGGWWALTSITDEGV